MMREEGSPETSKPKSTKKNARLSDRIYMYLYTLYLLEHVKRAQSPIGPRGLGGSSGMERSIGQ
jgi:hypothetical protein